MHIAIIVPSGGGIRNFVRDSFLEAWGGRSTVLHASLDEVWEQAVGELRRPPALEKMPRVPDTPVTFLLRQSLAYAHTHVADTKAMRYTRRRPLGGSWRTVAANRTARLIGWLAAGQTGVRTLERMHHAAVRRMPVTGEYREIFKRIKPDVVFSTCQKTPSVLPAILAAQDLGIPTAGFITSWDNITSKGRLAAPFDDYFLWSENMRRELLALYPNVDAARCHVVGSPQFDAYGGQEHIYTKEEFFARIGADPDRPLICYSGGDDYTSPEDQDIARILMEQVRAGVIRSDAQVLLRPCPSDAGDRYAQLRADFPEMLYEQPAWLCTRTGNYAGYVPLPADSEFLANLVRHADLNINVASTMTLDFGLHDRPVVNVAFDVSEQLTRMEPLWDMFYQWEHYKPVVDLGAARCARTPEQMAEYVNDYLANPSLDREGRKALADLQVGAPLGAAAETVAGILRAIAEGKSRTDASASASHGFQASQAGAAGR